MTENELREWRSAYELGYRAFYAGDIGGHQNPYRWGTHQGRAYNRGQQEAERELETAYRGDAYRKHLPLAAPPVQWGPNIQRKSTDGTG